MMAASPRFTGLALLCFAMVAMSGATRAQTLQAPQAAPIARAPQTASPPSVTPAPANAATPATPPSVPDALTQTRPSPNLVEIKPAALAVAPRPVAEPHVVTDGTGAATSGAEGRTLHELSPWSMFLAADIVVKGVMIGLMVASVVTWTILVGKTIELGVSRRRLSRALTRVGGATIASEARLALGQKGGLVSRLLSAATQELEMSGHGASDAGIKDRVASRLADLVRAETQSMRRGMGLLATIGSTAPFVGLFGTVWGIMNSFIGISKSQTTNLAVVAPGIAEALLATAVGLVAAIPAVIIYNHFSRATRSYQLLVSRASSAVDRLVSRDLDRTRGGSAVRAAK